MKRELCENIIVILMIANVLSSDFQMEQELRAVTLSCKETLQKAKKIMSL